MRERKNGRKDERQKGVRACASRENDELQYEVLAMSQISMRRRHLT